MDFSNYYSHKISPLLAIFMWVVAFILHLPTTALAQTVYVKNAPRTFTTVMPTSWTKEVTSTGNSRVKFASPQGTPPAECAVIVLDLPVLRGHLQANLDLKMAEIPSPTEMASQLSSRYNNVKILATSAASISGHPAQLTKAQYSVGTPSGELWAMAIIVTSATTPGLIWTTSCGALGWSPSEAQKAFSYWQSEIVRFHTNVKIQ